MSNDADDRDTEELQLAVMVSEGGNGHTPATRPSTRDLLLGLSATVGRLDREFEALRDLRGEDHALLKQIASDVKAHHAGVDRVTALILKVYQEKLAVPDPSGG
jgi:hypothetical protein